MSAEERAAIKARYKAAIGFLEYTGYSPWKTVIWPSVDDVPALLTALEEAEAKIAAAVELTSYVDENQSGQEVALAVLNALTTSAALS